MTGTSTWMTGNIIPTYQRIARTWKFQEKNGDVGNVIIRYPEGAVPYGSTGGLIMFVDTDANMLVGVTVVTGVYN